MANIKAKVRSNPNRIVAKTLKVGNIALTDLTDIDTSDIGEGAMLIYNATSSKFDVTPEVGNSSTNIIGGTY